MQTQDGKPIILEDAALEGCRRTRDGFLVANVRAARTGLYVYAGSEVGKPQMDRVRVYRPDTTVFDKKTLATFTSLDVTNDHPPEMINSKNWKKYTVGNTGEDIMRDGEFIRIPIIVKDEKTIRDVQDGKCELSLGYTCELDFTPGQTPDGQQYDAIQKNLSGNHLAIVDKCRAGPGCKIGDGDSGENKMTIDTKKIVVDGYMVTVTDESERAINNLQDKIKQITADNLKLAADSGKEIKVLTDKVADLEGQIKTKDAELGKKDAELKTLKDNQSDQSKLDQMLADRFTVVAKAKKLGLSNEDFKGKTNTQIVHAAVLKKLGDAAVKDRSDDYVQAFFDSLTGDVGDFDPVAAHLRDGKPANYGGNSNGSDDRQKAHNEMLDHLTNAWKSPTPVNNPVRQ